MFACNNHSPVLPNDLIESIMKLLSPTELGISASVCKAWKNIADQEKLWANFVTAKQPIHSISKQVVINQNKSNFFSIFSKELIDALGGTRK